MTGAQIGSTEAVVAAWELDVAPRTKLVALALADTGSSTVPALSKRTRMPSTQVIDALLLLAENSVVEQCGAARWGWIGR